VEINIEVIKMRQPDDHNEEEELIFLLEKDLETACNALNEIQKLTSDRADDSSDIARIALKDIGWLGKLET
jgi:hypothetical protein